MPLPIPLTLFSLTKQTTFDHDLVSETTRPQPPSTNSVKSLLLLLRVSKSGVKDQRIIQSLFIIRQKSKP